MQSSENWEGNDACKKEALIAVNDILSDLLTVMFSHVEKCAAAHTVVARRSSRGNCCTNGVLDTVREGDCNTVLTGFSHRSSLFQIIQLSVAMQHKKGYCGHYALHNALLARKICSASDTDEVQELVQMMTSSAAYWWRYWLSLKQLLGCVGSDTWWPWTEDYIITGDMERSFLHYLLEEHHFTASRRDPPILVMQYAYGFIQDSIAHVKKLHKAITSLKQSTGPSHLIFILGVTNHWSSALVTKDIKHNRHSISLAYFDSTNVPVVTFTDNDIMEHLKKKEEEKIKKKGKGWTRWEHHIAMQSCTDHREVVRLLANCAAGISDLRSEMIDREIFKFTNSFNATVVDQWKEMGNGKDDLVPLLLNWTQSYTPHSIHSTLVKLLSTFGIKCVSNDARTSLKNWIEFVDSNKLVHTDFTQLLSLYSVIDTLNMYLKQG